ncbi:hypothetical protein [Algirhabdus cladophorae]|uniref:hypothetical protein n=1 Tax=Algirhabdus cladophorae TaxID=3377108 RepID=UPI003B847BDF
MFKFFTAPVLALSIAVTGMTTAPVQADNGEMARIIAGFTALAIIGAAIHDSQNKSSKTKKKYVHKPQVHHQTRPIPKKHITSSRKVVPSSCLRNLKTKNGVRRGFGQGCLQRNYKYSSSLPHFCKTTVRSKGKLRTIFSAQCLRNQGYRMSRL